MNGFWIPGYSPSDDLKTSEMYAPDNQGSFGHFFHYQTQWIDIHNSDFMADNKPVGPALLCIGKALLVNFLNALKKANNCKLFHTINQRADGNLDLTKELATPTILVRGLSIPETQWGSRHLEEYREDRDTGLGAVFSRMSPYRYIYERHLHGYIHEYNPHKCCAEKHLVDIREETALQRRRPG